MASVVAFWRFPDEEPEFLDFFRSTGQLVALPFEKVRDRSQLAPQPLDVVLARDPDAILFGPAQLASGIVVHEYQDEQGPLFTVNPIDSTVVSYKRGKILGEKKLGGSDLSAEVKYADPTRTALLEKPVEFAKWFKKVFKWVRGATPESHQYQSYRVTRRVAQAIAEGWEIVP